MTEGKKKKEKRRSRRSTATFFFFFFSLWPVCAVGQALGTEWECVATRIGLFPGSVPGRREEGRERDAYVLLLARRGCLLISFPQPELQTRPDSAVALHCEGHEWIYWQC